MSRISNKRLLEVRAVVSFWFNGNIYGNLNQFPVDFHLHGNGSLLQGITNKKTFHSTDPHTIQGHLAPLVQTIDVFMKNHNETLVFVAQGRKTTSENGKAQEKNQRPQGKNANQCMITFVFHFPEKSLV